MRLALILLAAALCASTALYARNIPFDITGPTSSGAAPPPPVGGCNNGELDGSQNGCAIVLMGVLR